jgi:hypothetical protein
MLPPVLRHLNVGARLEWEHFNLDPEKASLVSAGIVVKF